MQELKDVFKLISLIRFIEKYTGLKYGSNLSCHIMGKPATAKDTRTQPTEQELIEIKKGLNDFADDVKKVAKKL